MEELLQDFMKDIKMTMPQLINVCTEEIVNCSQYEVALNIMIYQIHDTEII